MGFNVQGIAISKKYESAEKLAKELGIGNIKKAGDTYFEKATSSSIDDNDIFITEVENGTIVTLGTSFDIQEIPGDISNGGKALRFMVGETAMVFAFDYLQNGQSQRSLMNAQDENIMEQGEPLEIEPKETDFTEIIFGLIGDVTGTNFYGIEPDQKSTHYMLK